MRAKRGFRVRGSLYESVSHLPGGESPSPQPSPRKSGVRERTVAYPPIFAISASDTSKLA
jgi:hypothetical protein